MSDHTISPARCVFFGRTATIVAALALAATFATAAPPARQESKEGITHAFLATGGDTYFADKEGKTARHIPFAGRDGWALADGGVLLAASKCARYPSGAALELDKDNRVVFEFKGTQSEVDTVQPLDGGNILMTESGPRPRLLEVNRQGKVLVEFPLQCQTANFHMQTRMARKLANGNYLAPHLLDKAVREYDAKGKVVWEFKTPDEPKECWPFTAIRIDNGNTLIDCTHGNRVIEVDKSGAIVWQLTNADLPEPLLKDPCGGQRLPNGNTVITSYGAVGPQEVKMLEVTPDKRLVWTFRSGRKGGVHEFQILDTNGKSLEGRPLK